MIYLIPIAVAVFTWWLTTVVALYRIGMPDTTFKSTFAGASVLGLAGCAAVAFSATQATSLHAYIGFGGALAIWGWHELSYYLGFVSGPKPVACPEGCTTKERFVHGVRASLHHELLIVLTAVLLLGVSLNTENKVGFYTFCILWIMRWSVKLNIFLGVRNVHMEFLPKHLQYLASFMAHRRMNLLFPFSVALSVWVLYLLISGAQAAVVSTYTVTANVLLATLLALAVFEHILLVLKIPDAVLWRLGTASRNTGSA